MIRLFAIRLRPGERVSDAMPPPDGSARWYCLADIYRESAARYPAGHPKRERYEAAEAQCRRFGDSCLKDAFERSLDV